jgi:hypothetical protein
MILKVSWWLLGNSRVRKVLIQGVLRNQNGCLFPYIRNQS